jgi:hypothetical protein
MTPGDWNGCDEMMTSPSYYAPCLLEDFRPLTFWPEQITKASFWNKTKENPFISCKKTQFLLIFVAIIVNDSRMDE